MSTMAAPVPQQLLPQTNQRLGKNPQLPAHPVTAALDSQYSAEEAILRAQTAKSYADILQQLGWTDENGNFIPGQVSVNAARQQGELQRSSDIATEDVTNQAQRQGTLFSGKRATDTARAQYPFQQGIAQLGQDTPMALGALNEQAAGLMDQYTLQNNLLLSQAAARAASLAAQNSYGSSAAPAPSDGGGGAPSQGDQPAAMPPGYPNLNPEAPNQVFQPVNTSGLETSYEPRPNPDAMDQQQQMSQAEYDQGQALQQGTESGLNSNPDFGDTVPDMGGAGQQVGQGVANILPGIIDLINNAISATPGKKDNEQRTPSTTPNASRKRNLI